MRIIFLIVCYYFLLFCYYFTIIFTITFTIIFTIILLLFFPVLLFSIVPQFADGPGGQSSRLGRVTGPLVGTWARDRQPGPSHHDRDSESELAAAAARRWPRQAARTAGPRRRAAGSFREGPGRPPAAPQARPGGSPSNPMTKRRRASDGDSAVRRGPGP